MPDPGQKLQERTRIKSQQPRQYKVILLNDDYTTMEFVLQVLESVFDKTPAEAYRIMMLVHTHGQGIAGVYTWDVAETKTEAVVALAREHGYPLQAVTEEA
jgi:ATP-dependent Clp protease adaptor protein ClpS